MSTGRFVTDLSLIIITVCSLAPLAATAFFFVQFKSLELRRRIYASAHGLLAVLAFLFGITIDLYLATHEIPFAGFGSLLLYILTFVSIVYCFMTFSGNRLYHLLHLGTFGFFWVTAPFVVLIVGCTLGNCS